MGSPINTLSQSRMHRKLHNTIQHNHWRGQMPTRKMMHLLAEISRKDLSSSKRNMTFFFQNWPKQRCHYNNIKASTEDSHLALCVSFLILYINIINKVLCFIRETQRGYCVSVRSFFHLLMFLRMMLAIIPMCLSFPRPGKSQVIQMLRMGSLGCLQPESNHQPPSWEDICTNHCATQVPINS